MGFVVEKVTMGYLFLSVLQYFPLSIIPSLLHTHTAFIYHWWYIILATDNTVKHNTALLSHPKVSKVSQTTYECCHSTEKIWHGDGTCHMLQSDATKHLCKISLTDVNCKLKPSSGWICDCSWWIVDTSSGVALCTTSLYRYAPLQ